MIVKWVILIFLSFILWIQIINAELVQPNCSNPQEVANFFQNSTYLSLYWVHAKLLDWVQANVTTVNKNSSFNVAASSTENQVFLENGMTSSSQEPSAPVICDESVRAIFHISLLSLDSIDESNMIYTLDFWLNIAWIDHRVRVSQETPKEFVYLDLKRIKEFWKPDVVFRNARKITLHDQIILNQGLVIFRDGTLILFTKLTVSLTCAMRFENYPHDEQICDMKMESMHYHQEELKFLWDATNPYTIEINGNELQTPQFKIKTIETNPCSEDPNYQRLAYSCIRIAFHLQRNLGFHIIHTYIPSACVVILSWITFWIKPDAIAARIGLGVTSLLTIATFSSQSQKDLPPESSAKAIDVWMMTCGFFVFCSIMEFAIVNYLVSRFSENAEDTVNAARNPDTFLTRLRAAFPNARVQKISHYIDRTSRAVFPLAFLIFNTWYWYKYLN